MFQLTARENEFIYFDEDEKGLAVFKHDDDTVVMYPQTRDDDVNFMIEDQYDACEFDLETFKEFLVKSADVMGVQMMEVTDKERRLIELLREGDLVRVQTHRHMYEDEEGAMTLFKDLNTPESVTFNECSWLESKDDNLMVTAFYTPKGVDDNE